MKWVKAIGIGALFFGIVVLFSAVVPWPPESHKVGPGGQAWLEARGIAIATKMYVEDGGKFPEPSSLTNILFNPDKDGCIYLYRNAFKFNPDGKVCDPSGHPYEFKLTDHSITVTSTAYSVSAMEDFHVKSPQP